MIGRATGMKNFKLVGIRVSQDILYDEMARQKRFHMFISSILEYVDKNASATGTHNMIGASLKNRGLTR